MSRPEILSEQSLHRATGENGDFEGLEADKTVFGTYAREGHWGRDVVHFFSRHFGRHPGGLYVDAGANIGLTAVPVARLETVAATVCIEADPVNAALLRRNLDRNGCRAHVVEAAISDQAGSLSFERDPANFGDHRIEGTGTGLLGEDTRTRITVEARPLDAIMDEAGIEGPIALKSDIQGAEPLLFRGGGVTLERTETALIEYWPYGMARLGEDEAVFRAAIADQFSSGALIWPHAPTADPDWRSLASVFDEVDAVFSGGDSELHRIGCLNLALRKAAP